MMRMRTLRKTVLAMTVAALAALLLASCEYDSGYIPYETEVHRQLSAGTYEGASDSTLYRLTIGAEGHEIGTRASATLSLYLKSTSSNEWSTEPYVTYTGTYFHCDNETYQINDEWNVQRHVDEFDFTSSSSAAFPADEMDGLVAIEYVKATAGKEDEDGRLGQAYYPRIGTVVQFFPVMDKPFISTPDFVSLVKSFTMVAD